MMSPSHKWIGSAALALALLVGTAVVFLDATHLRGTIAHLVTQKTGRALAINGDLQWTFDWPQIRVHATDVTFANPAWAREKQMLAAAAVDLSLDLPSMLKGGLLLSDVQLDRPVVFFERSADGRTNWLLDQDQQDTDARLPVGRLTLNQGRVTFDDPAQNTAIVAQISTRPAASASTSAAGGAADSGILFSATGKYRGLPLTASGGGGPVIQIADDSVPYPLTIVATLGPTSIKAEGTVTGLAKQSAADVTFAVRGASLAELFDVLEIALPKTHAYSLAGHLTHRADGWRYEKFTGTIGQSDVGGSLHLTEGSARPLLTGDFASRSLNLADLGPVVGAQVSSAVAVRTGARALPTLPFRRDRWTTIDADVNLTAQTILRPKALPLEGVTAHLRMRDSVLTLDPLALGVAGGHLQGVIRLDGQHEPIKAHAKLEVQKLLLAKLLPTVALAQSSVGEINGDIELIGRGDSVAGMLATADGKIGLVVEGGKVSKLLMEEITAHLPEIVLQKISGDQLIDIRCGVADFGVLHGVMKIGVLVLDTDVTRIAGKGTVDLATETLDLTLIPSPKRMSLFALRGPISVRGEMAHPDLGFDATRVGVRGLAALVLAAINPALSLIALADPGMGKDSDCVALTRRTQAPWKKTSTAEHLASD